MSVLGELLFYRRDQVDLDAVLRQQVALLRNKVDALSDRSFTEQSDEAIAVALAGSEAIAPLEVDFAAAKADVKEVPLMVNDRFGFDRGPVRVQGLRAMKQIPFTGDPSLWELRTNPFDMNPPRGQIVGQTLVIGIEVAAHEADEASRYIDAAIASLPRYLEWQKAQIDAHNGRIAANAMSHIQQRRGRLSQASALLHKLQG